jgi:hypothetical protein
MVLGIPKTEFMEKEQENPRERVLTGRDSTERDFSTVSPSARSLLLLKGLTNIPFARQAAELMLAPEKYAPDLSDKDLRYWVRVVHFENRYWSIDQLLSDLPVKNILELSSGFSFRGLATVMQEGYYYIDTDLPGVIETKREFIGALQQRYAGGRAGERAGDRAGDRAAERAAESVNAGTNSQFDILPLNALDKDRFEEIVGRFPGGELAIVNEGLLMYLNMDEKRRLCGIIHGILKRCGGYWITADIYLKREMDPDLRLDDKLARFFEQHHVRDNMFESFQAAEDFFREEGFVIDKEAVIDPSRLSSLHYLMETATPEQLGRMGQARKIHASWRLKLP